MEKITLDHDIRVGYVSAKSFPEGIKASHDLLHSLVPTSSAVNYFGISRPESGLIRYKAAVEMHSSEYLNALKLETIVIRKGIYISILIENYTSDPSNISRVFDSLLSYPGLDPQGYCIEWYLGEHDVRCMIRLDQ